METLFRYHEGILDLPGSGYSIYASTAQIKAVSCLAMCYDGGRDCYAQCSAAWGSGIGHSTIVADLRMCNLANVICRCVCGGRTALLFARVLTWLLPGRYRYIFICFIQHKIRWRFLMPYGGLGVCSVRAKGELPRYI